MKTWKTILAEFISGTNIKLYDTLEIKTEFVVLKTTLNEIADFFEKTKIFYIDLLVFAAKNETENLLDAAIVMYSKMELYRQSELN